MSKFEIGDRVKCVSWDGGNFTAGEIYTVEEERFSGVLTDTYLRSRFELYAKAGEFVAGDVVVPIGRRDLMTVQSVMADVKRAILVMHGSIMGSWAIGNMRLATPEEIAAANLAAPKFSEVNPSIVIEPKPVVERTEIPASEFDFSTIKAGDEVLARMVVKFDGIDKDGDLRLDSGPSGSSFVHVSKAVSVILAPKPKTLRERAIEAATAAWNDASYSDRTIERLALAVLAEVERGEP